MKALSTTLARLGPRRFALAAACAGFGALYLATAAYSLLPLLERRDTLCLLAPVALWLVLRGLYGNAAFAGLLLLFPGITLSLIGGPAGVTITALLGGALLTLESRPVFAGVLFGLLAFRPDLAALAVLALLAGGHWRALGAAVATIAALMLAGLAVFGLAERMATFEPLAALMRMPEALARMPTVYAAARLMGAGTLVGHLLQAAAAVAAIALVVVIWRRGASLAWRGAALALALVFAAPYASDADLAVLVFPLAWLMQQMAYEESGAGEELLLALGWLAPAAFWVIALAGGPPVMPLLLAALMLLVWRRAFPARRLASADAVKVA